MADPRNTKEESKWTKWTKDSDGDGLSDYLEVNRYHTDPNDPDTDGDGLSDYLEEVSYETDPNDPDTDDDGLPDGAEVDAGLDPKSTHSGFFGKWDGQRDSDGDGLPNGMEVRIGLDMNKPDTDGDGVWDRAELIDHMDPTNVDTDGDGIPDGMEVSRYHTDPTKADTDGDGISDSDELWLHHTDPHNRDSDYDGLTDGAELRHGTDPNEVDSDGDGLSDLEDLSGRLRSRTDTDGDGIPDTIDPFPKDADHFDMDGDGFPDTLEDRWESDKDDPLSIPGKKQPTSRSDGPPPAGEAEPPGYDEGDGEPDTGTWSGGDSHTVETTFDDDFFGGGTSDEQAGSAGKGDDSPSTSGSTTTDQPDSPPPESDSLPPAEDEPGEQEFYMYDEAEDQWYDNHGNPVDESDVPQELQDETTDESTDDDQSSTADMSFGGAMDADRRAWLDEVRTGRIRPTDDHLDLDRDENRGDGAEDLSTSGNALDPGFIGRGEAEEVEKELGGPSGARPRPIDPDRETTVEGRDIRHLITEDDLAQPGLDGVSTAGAARTAPTHDPDAASGRFGTGVIDPGPDHVEHGTGEYLEKDVREADDGLDESGSELTEAQMGIALEATPVSATSPPPPPGTGYVAADPDNPQSGWYGAGDSSDDGTTDDGHAEAGYGKGAAEIDEDYNEPTAPRIGGEVDDLDPVKAKYLGLEPEPEPEIHELDDDPVHMRFEAAEADDGDDGVDGMADDSTDDGGYADDDGSGDDFDVEWAD